MEYEDDEQFAPLFISVQIESILKEELKKDVDAKYFAEFQKVLEEDLVEMAQQGSLEDAQSFIRAKLSKYAKSNIVLSATPVARNQPTHDEAALEQEYGADV